MPALTCERSAIEGEEPELNSRVHVRRTCEGCGSSLDHWERSAVHVYDAASDSRI